MLHFIIITNYKFQELSQKGQIFVPKYNDVTAAEGIPGFKFVCDVFTRSKVPANKNLNNFHNRSIYQNKFGMIYHKQLYNSYQYRDYSCKGFGSTKKEAKVNAASKLLSTIYGTKYNDSSDYVNEYKDNDNPKNPISLIQEYSKKNDLKPNYVESIRHGMYHCRLILGTVDTAGEGTNKKTAKSVAAASMVRILGNIKPDDPNSNLKPLNFLADPSEDGTKRKKSRNKKKSEKRVENNSEEGAPLNQNVPLFELSDGQHPISALQEFCQKNKISAPEYTKKVLSYQTNIRFMRKSQRFDFLVKLSIGNKDFYDSGKYESLLSSYRLT